MAVLVTQQAVEVLVTSLPAVRVTQQAVEVLASGTPAVRVTQQAVEVLVPTEAAVVAGRPVVGELTPGPAGWTPFRPGVPFAFALPVHAPLPPPPPPPPPPSVAAAPEQFQPCGPFVLGTPWSWQRRTVISVQELPKPAPTPSFPPEITSSPPIPGAPWNQRSTFPTETQQILVLAPPGPQSQPQSLIPEVTTGPPLRGAPWLKRLPMENEGRQLVVSPFRVQPPTPPTSGRGQAASSGLDSMRLPLVARIPDVPERLRRFTENVSIIVNSLLAQGYLRHNSSNSFMISGGAIAEERDPGPDDDYLKGIVVGAIWINSRTRNVFICVANEEGNAVWKGPLS